MPIIYMIVSVLLFGTYPLVAAKGAEAITPSAIVFLTHLSAAALIFLIIGLGGGFKKVISALSSSNSKKFKKTMMLFLLDGVCNALSNIFLILALVIINRYAAALIFDAWPILSMIIIPMVIFKSYRLTPKDYLFGIVSFVGIAIIVGSQINLTTAFSYNITEGYVFAILAMALMAISSMVNLKAEQELRQTVEFGDDSRIFLNTDLAYSTFSNGISRLISGSVALLYFGISGDEVFISGAVMSSSIAFSLVLFTLIITFGGILYVLANIRSTSSGINLLWNLTPVVSVSLFYVTGIGGTLGSDIAIGAIFIISANLAVAMEMSLSRSYYVFLFSFCVFAGYSHFVPGMEAPNFFEALALPTSIFAIITGFLISRVHQQKNTQLNLAINTVGLTQKLRAKRDKSSVLNHIFHGLSASIPDNFDLETRRISQNIRKKDASLADKIVHFSLLRLRHVSYAEATVVWLLAIIIGVVAMVFRDQSVIAQLIAVFVSAAAIFLASYATEYPSSAIDRLLILGGLGQGESTDSLLEQRHEEYHGYKTRAIIAIMFSVLLLIIFIVAAWINPHSLL